MSGLESPATKQPLFSEMYVWSGESSNQATTFFKDMLVVWRLMQLDYCLFGCHISSNLATPVFRKVYHGIVLDRYT